jgi:hypothetical protein
MCVNTPPFSALLACDELTIHEKTKLYSYEI